MVARLDRLARSTRDLLEIAEILKEGGTGLRSLGEPWADTTSPAGKMVLTVFAGMAEFERALEPRSPPLMLTRHRRKSGLGVSLQCAHRGMQEQRPSHICGKETPVMSGRNLRFRA